MVALEHKTSPFAGNRKIGSSTTYIYVDTTNNKIQFYINSAKVEEWS